MHVQVRDNGSCVCVLVDRWRAYLRFCVRLDAVAAPQ